NFGKRRPRSCRLHGRPYVPKTKSKPPLMTAAEVLAVLQRHYREPWATFAELRVGTGWGKPRTVYPRDTKGNYILTKSGNRKRKTVHDVDTTLDFFALHTWPSKKFRRIAFEVKVTRADYKNEIKKPWKREPGLAVSNEFYFVTPPGLLKKEEIFD